MLVITVANSPANPIPATDGKDESYPMRGLMSGDSVIDIKKLPRTQQAG